MARAFLGSAEALAGQPPGRSSPITRGACFFADEGENWGSHTVQSSPASAGPCGAPLGRRWRLWCWASIILRLDRDSAAASACHSFGDRRQPTGSTRRFHSQLKGCSPLVCCGHDASPGPRRSCLVGPIPTAARATRHSVRHGTTEFRAWRIGPSQKQLGGGSSGDRGGGRRTNRGRGRQGRGGAAAGAVIFSSRNSLRHLSVGHSSPSAKLRSRALVGLSLPFPPCPRRISLNPTDDSASRGRSLCIESPRKVIPSRCHNAIP